MASVRSGPAALARRARIVVLAGEGLSHTEVAERVGTSTPAVRHWRSRYACGVPRRCGTRPDRAGRVRWMRPTLWRCYGLQPSRTQTFKFSTYPQLEAKVRAVIGLYLDPPEGAVVLSVDEKSRAPRGADE